VNANVGQRVVVERHQLGIGPFSAAPIGERLAGGDKQVQDEHALYPVHW
jgi:hypothetical protein